MENESGAVKNYKENSAKFHFGLQQIKREKPYCNHIYLMLLNYDKSQNPLSIPARTPTISLSSGLFLCRLEHFLNICRFWL